MRFTPALARRPGAAIVAVLVLAGGLAATTASTAVARAPAARTSVVKVHRGGPDATVTFHRRVPGEVFLDVTVSARGVSWAEHENESAVVSAYVDGRYATDIVVTSSAPVTRQFALGSLGSGRHTLRLHYATRKSPSDAGIARLEDLRFRTVPTTIPAYTAAHYAPDLYGRNVAGLGGPFQNNRTDTPLVAWHRVLPAATAGHSVIEYSVMWSNEDGGTSAPSLMAKWGRTTDIEWVYRVEVDAQGRRVPGTGVFQSAGHGSEVFHGRYDGTHPILQTCTSNNNVCDSVALVAQKQTEDPMRFALSTRDVLPAALPREHEMDIHPWTYQVMAREMIREGKISEAPGDPSTLAVSNQRNYVYVAVTHTADPSADTSQVGLAVDVTLQGGATYSSDHMEVPVQLTVNRDGPAATTVELPEGTTVADVQSISVRRVPIGTDDGASLTVTDLDRAFFLSRGYLPQPSFAEWHGSVTLTAGSPTAPIWTAS